MLKQLNEALERVYMEDIELNKKELNESILSPSQKEKIKEITKNWGGKSWVQDWDDKDEELMHMYDKLYKKDIDSHNMEVFGFTW